jgi:hypothetical protein
MKTFRKTAHCLMRPVCLALSALLCTSCSTTSLWRSTDPNECIEVRYDQMTEAALIEDGFTYTKDDAKQFYFVEKSSKEKFRDYALRTLGTPVTVVADACIISFLAYGIAGTQTPADEFNWDKALAEWEYH